MKDVLEIAKAGLCCSCGLCQAMGIAQLREDARKGMYLPINPQQPRGSAICDCCPGAGYPIENLADWLFPEAVKNDLCIGRFIDYFAAYYNDKKIMDNATSGGIMTGIAAHLLNTGKVTGVISTKIVFTNAGPRAETFIASNIEDLMSAQGSKYCPTTTLAILRTLKDWHGRVAFIGTPCQIAGLRMLQSQDSFYKEKILLTIGNFCGGFRDLRETDAIIRRSGINPANVIRFRYRGGGQPGSMLIETSTGHSVMLEYPEYVRRTGFIKHMRCRLCIDATAELADLACGDAWLDRFINKSSQQWSLVIIRSKLAKTLVDDLIKTHSIMQESISLEEIKVSQAGNIDSKKNRYYSKARIYRLLCMRTPQYDGGYYKGNSGMLREVYAFVKQHGIHLIELAGLYPLFARVFHRYK